MRAHQVLWRTKVVLPTPVHRTPPANRVRMADRTILIILVPTESSVGIDEQHVRGAPDLFGPAELGDDVPERGVVEKVPEAVVGHPHVPLDVVVHAARPADQRPHVRVLDLEVRDGPQELHPILHATLDHEDTVLLELQDLLLGDVQALAELTTHDARGQRHLWILNAELDLQRIDGLVRDGIRLDIFILAHIQQPPDTIANHHSTSDGEHNAAYRVVLRQPSGPDHGLQPVDLLRVHPHRSAGGHVLRSDAREGEHREPAVLQLLVLLHGELLKCHVPAHLPSAFHWTGA
mmetsp:Transcript_89326/g.227211  ORF Transcript_89326/g.227211 Transcript_89326/m.227211 type:complete len:291 (+) Transcript_89326:722-1594(+)